MSLNVKSLRKFCLYIIITQTCVSLTAQSPKELFSLSNLALSKGDFIESEKYLLTILEQKEGIKKMNLIAVYNQLGIINKNLGRYKKAINYYQAGENIALNNKEKLHFKLPSLYNNLGNTFKLLGDYKKAIEYYQESLKNSNTQRISSKERNEYKALALNNIGQVYFEQKDYLRATESLSMRVKIGEKYNLAEQDLALYNFANCLRELQDYKLAEIYYKKCINIRLEKFGKEYYKLPNVYMSLGKLKLKTGNNSGALFLYKKAFNIYKLNYGEKHPYIAELLEVMGDYHLSKRIIKKQSIITKNH